MDDMELVERFLDALRKRAHPGHAAYIRGPEDDADDLVIDGAFPVAQLADAIREAVTAPRVTAPDAFELTPGDKFIAEVAEGSVVVAPEWDVVLMSVGEQTISLDVTPMPADDDDDDWGDEL